MRANADAAIQAKRVLLVLLHTVVNTARIEELLSEENSEPPGDI